VTELLGPKEARRVLRALRSGVVPDLDLADRVFIGQDDWFRQAVQMMKHNAEDQDFEVRFVRARYGGGKTLFLRRLEYEAGRLGWATAYVLLRHGKVELDKVQTLATELAEQVRVGDEGRGLAVLLKSAVDKFGRRFGYDPVRGNSLETHDRIVARLNDECAKHGFSYDVTVALRSACRSVFSRADDRVQLIAKWLGGGTEKLGIPARHVGSQGTDIFLKPLGMGAAEELVRLMAVLVQLSGRAGFFITLDEVELVGALPAKRRANAFQTLRALVDQKDSSTQPPATSLFLAATPQMFEDPEMFPSYKALQDRIEVMRPTGSQKRVNFKAPIVDLDATELQEPELTELAGRIAALHEVAGETPPPDLAKQLRAVVKAIAGKHFVVARPRLLCRAVMDVLDGQLGDDVEGAVASLNDELLKKRTAEMDPGEAA
jgi:hypothetical protein